MKGHHFSHWRNKIMGSFSGIFLQFLGYIGNIMSIGVVPIPDKWSWSRIPGHNFQGRWNRKGGAGGTFDPPRFWQIRQLYSNGGGGQIIPTKLQFPPPPTDFRPSAGPAFIFTLRHINIDDLVLMIFMVQTLWLW